VVLGPRPLTINDDNFAEVMMLPAPGFPYGGASMQFLWLPPAGFFVFDLSCTQTPFPARGTLTKIGQGCPLPAVTYEVFDNVNNPMDLSNRTFRFTPLAGGGYTMTQPGGGWFSGFTTNLNAGDNTTHVRTLPFAFPLAGGTLGSVIISSNGFIWLSTINAGAACCAPLVPIFVGSLPRVSAMWTDLLPGAVGTGANGAVYADVDPGTGQYVVTWNNVGEAGVTPVASNTFQIALAPSGAFEIRYLTVQHAHPTRTALAGFSAGSRTSDPGPTNLSAVTSMFLGSGTPLDLGGSTATMLPRLGQPLTLALSGLPPAAPLVLFALSFSESIPPFDLTPIGGWGCFAYSSLFSPIFSFFVPGGAATVPFTLAVPLNLSLAGVTLIAQGAVTATVPYPLGVKLSNGVRMVIGL
jgi:hypothetical protein